MNAHVVKWSTLVRSHIMDMSMLTTLVQTGPTGAGLAFAILGFWLLQREQGSSVERPGMLGAIRFFIGLSLIVFVIGIIASLVSLFADKIVRANAGTISSALSTDLVTARFTTWWFDANAGSVSFTVNVVPMNFARYISKNDTDSFKLIVTARPKNATPHEVGSYPIAFGYYPFESIWPQTVPLTPDMTQAGCIELVLFRISKAAADKKPFKTPFAPADYGNDLQEIAFGYDGKGCS
jgi:hypothetical protein